MKHHVEEMVIVDEHRTVEGQLQDLTNRVQELQEQQEIKQTVQATLVAEDPPTFMGSVVEENNNNDNNKFKAILQSLMCCTSHRRTLVVAVVAVWFLSLQWQLLYLSGTAAATTRKQSRQERQRLFLQVQHRRLAYNLFKSHLVNSRDEHTKHQPRLFLFSLVSSLCNSVAVLSLANHYDVFLSHAGFGAEKQNIASQLASELRDKHNISVFLDRDKFGARRHVRTENGVGRRYHQGSCYCAEPRVSLSDADTERAGDCPGATTRL